MSVRDSTSGSSSLIWLMALFAVSMADFECLSLFIFGIGSLLTIRVSLAVANFLRMFSFIVLTFSSCSSIFSGSWLTSSSFC